MKWTTRLREKNAHISTCEQNAKDPLDTLGTSSLGANDKFFTASRSSVKAQYPEILTLPDGRKVRLSDVLDQALTVEDDPLLAIGDWPDLMRREVLAAFAYALLLDGAVHSVT